MKWKQRNKQRIKERNQRKNKTNKLIKTTEKHEEETANKQMRNT